MPTMMELMLTEYTEKRPRQVLLGADADAAVERYLTEITGGSEYEPPQGGQTFRGGLPGARLPVATIQGAGPTGDLARLSQRPEPAPLEERQLTELSTSQYLPHRLGSALLERPAFAAASGALGLLRFVRDATLRNMTNPGATTIKKLTPWLSRSIEVLSEPERYGLLTPAVTEFAEAKRAFMYHQGLLAGATDDILEQGIDIGSYFLQLAIARRLFPLPGAATRWGARVQHLGFIGAHAIAFTDGPADERTQAALWRMAYNFTPFLANATGATGLRAVTVDSMLNVLLSTPAYAHAFREHEGITPEFLAQIFPQFMTDVAFALNTRGLPENIAVKQYETLLKTTGRTDGISKTEIKQLLKDYRTLLLEGRAVTMKGDKATSSKGDLPEFLDNYFADRDDHVVKATVDRINLQNRITDYTKSGKFGKAERRLDQTMQLYIDLRNAEERGFGTPQEQLAKWAEPSAKTIAERADRLGLTDEARAEFIENPPMRPLTKDELKLFDESQRLPPVIRDIAEDIIRKNRELGKRAQDAQVLRNAYDNWTMRLWQTGGREQAYMARKFGTTTARALPRSLESILHGWTLDMQLRLKGASTAMESAHIELAKVIADRELLKAAQKARVVSIIKQPDWERIQHPNFRQWVPLGERPAEGVPGKVAEGIKPGIRVIASDRDNIGTVVSVDEASGTASVHFVNRLLGTEAVVDLPLEMLSKPKGKNIQMPNVFITDTGQVLLKAELFAPKELAHKLNNIFGVSPLFKIPGVRALTKWNSIVKSVILTSAFFHHQAFARSYWLGGRTGVRDALPTHGYKEGQRALLEYRPEVRDLVRAGMTIGLRQDWEEQWLQEKTWIGRVIDHVPGARNVRDKLLALREANSQFLFGKLGPYWKTHVALLEYRALVKERHAALEAGTTTRHEIAGEVARLVNDDFGGLHLGRMARNPLLQHAFHIAALAPDWTESNVRSMVKAFRAGDEGRIYRQFWGRILWKGISGVVLLNLALSAFDDEDFVTRYKESWEAGNLRWLDIDATPLFRLMGYEGERRRYWRALGHFVDPFKFVAHPVRSAKHKGSVVTRAVIDLVTAQDWAGRQFTTAEQLFGLDEKGKDKWKTVKWEFGGATPLEWAQIPSWAAYEIRGWTPIQSQQFLSYIAGEIDGISAVAGSLGIQVTPPGRKKEKGETILSVEEIR